MINEMAWRTLSTDAWVTVETIETPASIVCYILITRLTAPRYWNGPDP